MIFKNITFLLNINIIYIYTRNFFLNSFIFFKLLKKKKKKIFFLIQKNKKFFFIINFFKKVNKNKKLLFKKKKDKEVRLNLNIGINDYKMKLNKVSVFLKKGYSVKIVVIFKGREMIFKERGIELILKFQNSIKGIFFKFSDIEVEGRNIYSIFLPKKK